MNKDYFIEISNLLGVEHIMYQKFDDLRIRGIPKFPRNIQEKIDDLEEFLLNEGVKKPNFILELDEDKNFVVDENLDAQRQINELRGYNIEFSRRLDEIEMMIDLKMMIDLTKGGQGGK